jgi:hypothetical protein
LKNDTQFDNPDNMDICGVLCWCFLGTKMNKRLLHLLNEAGFHQPEMERLGIEHKFEKLAELIVRECAEVGYDSVEDGDDIDAIMRRVHTNILKHFGVEE